MSYLELFGTLWLWIGLEIVMYGGVKDTHTVVGTEETILYCLGSESLDMIWDYLCPYKWDCDHSWESDDEIEDRFWG
jgi:hypothetical protein